MPDEKKKGFDLAAALGAVPNLGTDTDGREQLKYIDIDLIDPDPRNRKVDGIEALAQNIAIIGLRQPLQVRPNPDAEGRYIAVSGHRRRLAIKLLVDGGEERYRMVPCLVDDEESPAMRMLKMLSDNILTQPLSSAEMADAAQKVEDCIYQLKEEGHEFPGKVRAYVAETCGIAASRVGRLKTIREKLIDPWRSEWEAGVLNESAASELAGMTAEDQEQWYLSWLQSGKADRYLVGWHIETYREYLENMDEKGCLYDSGKCVRQDIRRRERARDGRCATCCNQCAERATCADACPLATKNGKEMAAQKAAYAANLAKMREEREAAQKEKEKFALAGWKRLGDAMQAAGLVGEGGKYLHESLDWGDEDDIAEFDSLLAGTLTKNSFYGDDHPLENVPVDDIVRMADDLKVSVDYLMGRTDNPAMPTEDQSATPDEPAWLTGSPKRDGRYYCMVEVDGNRLPMTLRWVSALADWRMAAGYGLSDGCTVVGWWPLPKEDGKDE